MVGYRTAFPVVYRCILFYRCYNIRCADRSGVREERDHRHLHLSSGGGHGGEPPFQPPSLQEEKP